MYKTGRKTRVFSISSPCLGMTLVQGTIVAGGWAGAVNSASSKISRYGPSYPPTFNPLVCPPVRDALVAKVWHALLRYRLMSLCGGTVGVVCRCPPVRDEIVICYPAILIHFHAANWFLGRILRKIAADQLEDLGDTSTLADPSVVDQIIKEHRAHTAKR